MDETKPCPYCGEPIQKVARKCKWCGEWLDEDNCPSQSFITCPTCGEQIPEGSKICPLCKEPLTGSSSPKQVNKTSKSKIRPLYIVIGVIAVVVLGVGGVLLKNYLNDKEYQETIENSPYSIISKNLEEAVAKGQMLNFFLRDEKNVDALKSHFGEDVYSLMLALSFYSDQPLTSCDPKDTYAGGYAWRTAGDKGRYGCRLILGPDKLCCKYYYDGMEVDQYGLIVRNDHWTCDYYKDDFNEDDTSKPYIEQMFDFNGNYSGYCRIRLDNVWGVSFSMYDAHYYDQILFRNNDTGEVWNLPIDKVSSSEAVLRKEGQEQFTQWFQTARSITMSATDSTGQYSPSTVTLDEDEMRFYDTFMAHVNKRQVQDNIFVKHDFN